MSKQGEDMTTQYVSAQNLKLGIPEIEQSPRDQGRVEMIVIRPQVDQRQSLTECYFSPEAGAQGDTWRERDQQRGRQPNPNAQIAVMNIRSAHLIAGTQAQCQWAGDNLFVDFDLSVDSLQPGQRLTIGEVRFEMTPKAHNGCHKFAARFGQDALQFVNSERGKHLHLRGVYLKVLQPGIVKVGDVIQRCEPSA